MVNHTHEHIHNKNSMAVFKRFKWILGQSKAISQLNAVFKRFKWIFCQSKAALGFICNYDIASNAHSFL